MSYYLLLLCILVLFSLLAATLRNMLFAAVSLAVASIALTLILFAVSAPWAAIFELSVCAGLITVLFVSAVSMIRKEELFLKEGRLRFALLPLLVAVLGLGLWVFGDRLAGALWAIPSTTEKAGIGMLLWGIRIQDLLGQVCMILAGALAIRAFFSKGRG